MNEFNGPLLSVTMSIRGLCIILASLVPTSALLAASPNVVDSRLVLEQVAREPEIVTPTGLTVDEEGRIWVIENNTHQREPKYRGHPSDRVRIFDQLDPTGRARRVTTFADGFKDAMSLAFSPDGTLYLATRAEIVLFRRKGDKLIERKTIMKLVTAGTYPHNGLCGFAFDGVGNLYFGMGENLGADYKLIGSDNTTIAGGGEGGNMFRCRPDGTKLVRIATGFWNPFHHTFDAFGRLFVVDNDPDSRGPCRLLHIVPGGDYGYKFRYGRKGTHPFQSWDGELPGTLGMVAGTGEAPSGVLAYESTSLPSDYRGNLLVTSWGDHTIERYELIPRGASFSARMHTVVRGGEDFRPVAIATGPDGAVYFSDWVDKSYPVHGKGRIWRLRGKDSPKTDILRPSKVSALPLKRLGELLGHPRQEVRQAASIALGSKGKAATELLTELLKRKGDARTQIHALWAAARLGSEGHRLVQSALESPHPEVRAEAVRLVDVGSVVTSHILQMVEKDPSPIVRMQAILRLGEVPQVPGLSGNSALIPYLYDPDPFLLSAAINSFARFEKVRRLIHYSRSSDPRLRLGALLTLRKRGDSQGAAELKRFLADPDPEVRRCAMQWVGEERLKEWAGQLETAATTVPTKPPLFRALLAARHLLAGGKPDAEPIDEKWLSRVLYDSAQPSVFRALALRMLGPNHPALAPDQLGKLLSDRDLALRHQAARTLALRGGKGAEPLLLGLAKDNTADIALRADAVMGLASLSASPAVRKQLLALLENPQLRRDSLRSLRGATHEADVIRSLLAWWAKASIPDRERPEFAGQMVLALRNAKGAEIDGARKLVEKQTDPRPATSALWQRYLAMGGDPAAGERIFFHPNGPGCSRCHRIDDHGATVGPDLSTIGSSMNRERLVESILQPSKEIAPRYVAWRFVIFDGKVRVGVVVDEGPNSTITLADAEGKQHTIKRQDVEERTAMTISIMPENLHEQMTPQEFRDLIAYLAERSSQSADAKKGNRSDPIKGR
jgi:putative membrane-bound dehydrogenase-like protein